MSMGEAIGQRGGRWRSDAPPLGRVVEVWYINAVILAVFHGDVWRTVEGQPLREVTHWRSKTA